MYSTFFSLDDRSIAIEAPERLRQDLEKIFGRPKGQKRAKGARRIVVSEEDHGRFGVRAPYTGWTHDLGAAETHRVLAEEIVRSLVFELESGVAIHAGAVGWRKKAVLVVGPSRVGKTSLVAWLASNGFDYLSDELVMLAEDGKAKPFARPLIVKSGSREAIAPLSLVKTANIVEIGEDLVIAPGQSRTSSPARDVGLLIFVRFQEGADLEIEPLSPARCISHMMGCNLNARNIEDDGFALVSRLATTAPAIALGYGAFEQLDGVVDRLTAMLLDGDWRPAETSRLLSAFGRSNTQGAAVLSQPASGLAELFPIPEPTVRRLERKLTIGMATYDDYDGVYFSLQALRLFHAGVMDDVELLVLDNHPDGPCSGALKKLENSIENYRYVPVTENTGTAIRDRIFSEAAGDYVLCVDCHVLIVPDGVKRLLEYYRRNPDSPDLLQGPMIYDGLRDATTHFVPDWRGGMYGRWSESCSFAELEEEPFEIPMQGLGLFSCRKTAWPGFNPDFRGFGGEEFYIHEKFRQAGSRTLCLPFLGWVHRFDRPMGLPYPNTWEDRIRNYLIGFSELGLPTTEMEQHFEELLGEGVAARIFAQARRDLRLPDEQAAE